MGDYDSKVFNALKNNALIKDYYDNLTVTGTNPWELAIDLRWKGVGRIKISSFTVSDFWALREWWNNSLTHYSKYLFFLFPSNEKMDRYIANHFKNHESHRSIIFNAWLMKEGFPTEYFDNEIIGHFFLLMRNSNKPLVGIGVANKFQGKKLGTLFMSVLIYITKMLGKKTLWLTTSKDNKVGYSLYKKLGFEDVGEKEVYVHTEGYKRMEYEMKLDLDKFK